MAGRELIASREILEAAFAITRQKGFLEVTARSVASKAGCSTQPVFRAYRNMEELRNAVYNRAVSFFQDYCSLYPKTGKTPFSNLGMAYIAFAREESCLFEFLFVSGKPKSSFYELLNGTALCGNLAFEISLARECSCPEPEAVFLRMWLLIHGAACMTLRGEYGLSEQETLQLLENSYRDFSGNMD